MGSDDDDDDDDKDFSVHDLEHVPEFLPHTDDRFARRRAFSDGHMVGLPIGADEFGEKQKYSRARVWSSGGSSSSLPYLRSPGDQRKAHKKIGFLRRTYSKKLLEPGEALRIPEEDLLSENFSLGTPSPVAKKCLLPRLSLSSHSKSNSDAGDESENSTRRSLKDYTVPEIQPSNSLVSMNSPTSEYEDVDEDSSFYTNGCSERDERTQPTLWGIPLPAWFAKKRPSWNRVAACVVTKAPCFLCFRLSQKTDRAIVERLNILCAFFAFFQLLSAVLLFVFITGGIAEHDVPDYAPTGDLSGPDSSKLKVKLMANIWNINGAVFALGGISFLLFATTIIIVPVVRNVNLLGAIRYLWLLLWIIPFQVTVRLSL